MACDGVLILNKPQGFTSHDAVAKARGIFRQRKAGHAGTLDPMAEGVLVIMLGAATKAAEYIQAENKRYRAGIRLGYTSDTLDIWGDIKPTGGEIPSADDFTNALYSFEGGYMQLPPMVSAKMKDGVRLYELARRGLEVQRTRERVDISCVNLLEYHGGEGLFEVSCSKGTYIRSLCADIGEVLGCGAVMSSLVRLRCGDFTLEHAVNFETLQQLRDEGREREALIPLEEVFSGLPRVILNEGGFRRGVSGAYVDAGMVALGEIPEEEGVLCALYSPEGRLVLLSRSGRLKVSGEPALFHEKTFYTGDRP